MVATPQVKAPKNPFTGKATSASPGGGPGFELPRPGNHLAVLVALIDLGSHEEEYRTPGQAAKVRTARKVMLTWELVNEKIAGQARNHVVYKEYGLNFHKMGNLRKDLENWHGAPYAEEAEIDLTKILGKPCLVSVTHHVAASGKKYVKVTAVSALPDGMPLKQPTYKPFAWFVGCDDPIPTQEWLPYVIGEAVKDKILRCLELKEGESAEDEERLPHLKSPTLAAPSPSSSSSFVPSGADMAVRKTPFAGRATGGRMGIDRDQVRRALNLFVVDKTLGFEIRGLPSGQGRIRLGSDTESLIAAAEEMSDQKGTYWGLNPRQVDLARQNVCGKKDDVVRRYWLLIDCDPVRPKDTNATQVEKEAALYKAGEDPRLAGSQGLAGAHRGGFRQRRPPALPHRHGAGRGQLLPRPGVPCLTGWPLRRPVRCLAARRNRSHGVRRSPHQQAARHLGTQGSALGRAAAPDGNAAGGPGTDGHCDQGAGAGRCDARSRSCHNR